MLMTSIRLNSLVSLSVGYLHLNVLLKKSSLVYCWCRHGYNQTLTRTSSQFVPHICTPSKPHLHLHLRIRPFVWCRSHVQALPIASFLATNTCRLASRVCFSQSQWFNIVWADCISIKDLQWPFRHTAWEVSVGNKDLIVSWHLVPTGPFNRTKVDQSVMFY